MENLYSPWLNPEENEDKELELQQEIDNTGGEFIPVTEDSPIPDFIPVDAEPATEAEIEAYAEERKAEKEAIRLGQIERNIQRRKEEYALRDEEGNIVYDEMGNILERDVSTGEMMLNSVMNVVHDTKSAFANMGVGVNEVVQKLVGDEALEEWAEDYDSDFLRAFTDEGTEALIAQAELFESERDEHTGQYTGEDSNIAAAFVNSVTSIGSSAIANTVTLGGGLPMQFFGDFYRSYNEEVATQKGKSLKQLRDDGEDSFWAPMAFGMLAGVSERVGLKGAGKTITDLIKKPVAKKVAHRLLSGNKEGLTELFQTGLELANTAHARGEDATQAFVDGVSSREGLEAYLQGFTGGATLAGKGQNQRDNIKKLQKAAAGMRAPVDSKKIDDLVAKRVELAQALSNTSDPQVKDLINKQIKDAESALKYVIPQANGIVRKMTDPQVEQANKIFDKAKDITDVQMPTLLQKYKDGQITIEEYKPARAALQTELNKLQEQGSKLKATVEEQPNIRNKDLVSPNATGIWNTKVKDVVDTKLASGNAWDVIQNKDVQTWVKSVARQEWNKVPDDIKARTTFDDVVNASLYGGGTRQSQSLLGLLESYNKEGGKAKASSYIYAPMKHKVQDVIKTLTDQRGEGKEGQHTASVETGGREGGYIEVEDTSAPAEITTKAPKELATAETVAARLGISPQLANEAKQEATEFISNLDSFAGDKKFEQDTRKFFVDKLKDKIQNEMGKKDNYHQWLTNNAERVIPMLPKKSLAQRRDESQSWVDTPPTPREFVEYMRSGNQTKKKRALAEIMAHTIGLRATRDIIDSNSDLQVQEQQTAQKEASGVQQEVNGRFHDQFQETTEIAEDDFEAQNKATDKVLEDNKLGKTINTKDDKQFQEGRNWISTVATKYFPREFFTQGMFANAGASAQSRGFFFTSAQDLDENVAEAKSDPNSVYSKQGRYIYGNKDLGAIKKNWGKIQENNKNNWNAFEQMWKTFGKMYADDKNNAKFISAILKSAQNSQNHLSRTAAGLVAYSNSKGKHARYEEEHSLPQSAVSRYLMQTMVEGGDLESALKNVQQNFFQVALNKDDDAKLKKKGEYNYASKMPQGWKMSDNTWARYFNDNVNNNNGGIDPNSITFFETGKTVAETYGAKTNAPKTADVKAAQQAVVAEKVGDPFIGFMDSAINSLNKLLGDRGALHSNFAHIPVNILIGGLRATKLAYKGGRNLIQALDAGYDKVKAWMSKQEWNEFTKMAVKEVKNQKTPKQRQLEIQSENAIKNEQARRASLKLSKDLGLDLDQNTKTDDILSAIQDKLDKKDTEKKGDLENEFDRLRIKKKPNIGNRIFNKFIIGSKAEDFKGLMYRVFPTKEGTQWVDKNLIDPYIEGVEKLKNFRYTNNRIFRKAAANLGRKNVLNIQPTKLQQALNTKDFSQLSPAEASFAKEIGRIDGGKFAASLVDDINIASQMYDYMNKVKRSQYLDNFVNNVNKTLRSDGKINPELTKLLGEGYAGDLDNMLDRMISGVNKTQYSKNNKEAQRLLDVVNESNSIIMHLNGRSAVLQLISIANYIPTWGMSMFDFKGNAQAISELTKSKYMKERFGNKGFELEASEIMDSKKSTWVGRQYKKLLNLGFTPTAAADFAAIVIGGAPMYNNLLKKYNGDKDLAMKEFVKFTEENQQSSDPSKISALQAGSLGRLVFAFLNTPFQYARLSKRAIQDIIRDPKTAPSNLPKLAWYGAVQSMVFGMLQNLFNINDLFNWFDDEEDEEDWKVGNFLKSALDSNLKTLGLWGTGAAWALGVGREYKKQADGGKLNPEKLVVEALKVSPPVSRKASDLIKAGQYLRRQNRGKTEEAIKSATLIGDFFNLPSYRYYQKIENLKKVMDEDSEGWERILRAIGYSDYAIGKDDDKNLDGWGSSKGYSNSDSGWGKPKQSSNNDDDGWDSPINKLGRGEMGQAHRDGTIEVDPNLSPLEKAKTIAHEEQHVEDMKTKGLDYDDKFIYYEGKKFARKNGKIRHAGEWKKEGHETLPWEQRAYEAEKDVSPLKKDPTDYDKMRKSQAEQRAQSRKYAKKYNLEDKSIQDIRYVPMESGGKGIEQYGGTYYRPTFLGHPGDFEAPTDVTPEFAAARDWTKAWEENPETIRKDMERTGATEEELLHARERQLKAGFNPIEERETNAGLYSPSEHSISVNPKFKGAEGYSPESVIAHEFAHAGRDLQRGLHAQEILGEIKIPNPFNDPKVKEYQSYVNRPHEQYAFLQQLRHSFGLKPGEDLTEDMIKKAKEAGDENPLLNVDPKKLIEANKKVAEFKPKQKRSLEDLYSNNNDNKYYT